MNKPLGPYSPAVRAGHFLVVSGQTGSVDGALVPGGLDDFAAMNAIYVEAMDGHRPARSTVAVAALPIGACVEIEAWADPGPDR